MNGYHYDSQLIQLVLVMLLFFLITYIIGLLSLINTGTEILRGDVFPQ